MRQYQYAKPLNKLINELSKLPGIGGKTAQRLAFHILSMDDKDAFALADAGSQCEDRDDVLFCVWKFDRSGSLCDLF